MNNNLNKFKVKINKINISNNQLLIVSNDNIEFMSPIKKGSVECKIYNELLQEVNIGNLQENNLITIYGFQNNKKKLSDNQKLYNYLTNNYNENNENNEKNIIIIKKIMVKNNYVFNSESSSDCDCSDYDQFNLK